MALETLHRPSQKIPHVYVLHVPCLPLQQLKYDIDSAPIHVVITPPQKTGL